MDVDFGNLTILLLFCVEGYSTESTVNSFEYLLVE